MCDLYTFKHPQCDHHDSAIDAQVHKTCIHQFTSPHVEQVGTIDAPRSSAGDVHSFTRDGQGNSSKRSPWVLKAGQGRAELSHFLILTGVQNGRVRFSEPSGMCRWEDPAGSLHMTVLRSNAANAAFPLSTPLPADWSPKHTSDESTGCPLHSSRSGSFWQTLELTKPN